jgi:hypothetical protein
MKTEYFLTPVFFMLDPEIRFPIINGNKSVQNLLNELEVADSDLQSQYIAMVKLYGHGGILDAADLDQVGQKDNLSDFLNTDRRTATKKLLETKDTSENSELSLKDEADIEEIRKAGLVTQRRIHNQLTNKLKNTLKKYTLLEGSSQSCMFDVLVKKYNNYGNDLLIEVKSSVESPHIRMAVGQLFDYWFALNRDEAPHLAVLLPERPANDVISLLQWLNVGIIWFEDEQICTEDDWLRHITC